MPNAVKLLIGLAVALVVGWVVHGPLGRGEAFVDTLDAGVQQALRQDPVAGVTAHVQRDPLARTVILSGPADEFQRTGRLSAQDRGDPTGAVPGINGRMLRVPGIGRVEWTNPPP